MKRVLGKIDSHYREPLERDEAFKNQVRADLRAKNGHKLAVVLGTLSYRRFVKRK